MSIRRFAVASATVIAVRAALTDCFDLNGVVINGEEDLQGGYARAVMDNGTWKAFVPRNNLGVISYSTFSLNNDTGVLSVSNTWTIDPKTIGITEINNGAQGRVVTIAAGSGSDIWHLDTPDKPRQLGRLALNCTVTPFAPLNCGARDDPSVNVFNYCDGDIVISDSVRQDLGCLRLLLLVIAQPIRDENGNCRPAPTTDMSSTAASTSTTFASTASSTKKCDGKHTSTAEPAGYGG